MQRERAIQLIDALHRAQNEFYGGGGSGPLTALLARGVIWTVPGESAIAGMYRGRDEVLAYFRRRRTLAGGSFRMERRDILVGDRDRIAALTDGTATIDGVEHRWSTVGLYAVTGSLITACWLLALDQQAFDAIWSPCCDRRDSPQSSGG